MQKKTRSNSLAYIAQIAIATAITFKAIDELVKLILN